MVAASSLGTAPIIDNRKALSVVVESTTNGYIAAMIHMMIWIVCRLEKILYGICNAHLNMIHIFAVPNFLRRPILVLCDEFVYVNGPWPDVTWIAFICSYK